MVQVLCTLFDSGKPHPEAQRTVDLEGSDVAALLRALHLSSGGKARASGPVLRPFLDLPDKDLGHFCASLADAQGSTCGSAPTVIYRAEEGEILVREHHDRLPADAALIPGACYSVFRVPEEDPAVARVTEKALPKASFNTKATREPVNVVLRVRGFAQQEAALDGAMTVDELCSIVRKQCGANAALPVFLHGRGALRNASATLHACGVRAGSVLEVGPCRPGTMDLCVRMLTGTVVVVSPRAAATVEDLKEMVQNVEGIPVHQMRLIFAGKQLEDWRALRDYGIEDGAEVHLVLRLRGGMFHPSSGAMGFARCGAAEEAQHLCKDPGFCDGLKTSVRVLVEGGGEGGGDMMVGAFSCDTKEELAERVKRAAAARGGAGGAGDMLAEIKALAEQLPGEEGAKMLQGLLAEMRAKAGGGRGGGGA